MVVSNNDVLKSGILDFKIFQALPDVFSECRGKNQKGIFIAAADESTPELTELLTKIFAAVQVDLEEDALTFFSPKPRFSFSKIRHQALIHKVLFFGIAPAKAGLHLLVQPYQPLSFKNTTFMFAHPLSKIKDDRELKGNLWAALKTMF